MVPWLLDKRQSAEWHLVKEDKCACIGKVLLSKVNEIYYRRIKKKGLQSQLFTRLHK